MALQQDVLDLKIHLKFLFKEIRVGLILGILYGILLGLFAIFRFLDISPILGLVVGLSICASMLIAATIGSLVPLILDRFDIDPAVATGPFVTTAIDILGVALYFIIAGALFNLVLTFLWVRRLLFIFTTVSIFGQDFNISVYGISVAKATWNINYDKVELEVYKQRGLQI